MNRIRDFFQRFGGEAARAIRNGHYERDQSGILLPRLGVFLGGAFKVKDYRDGSEQYMAIDANTLLDQGLTHMLNVCFPPSGGYAQIAQWYIAPFSNDYTPVGSLTAADFPGTAGEFTSYIGGSNRKALTIPAAATTPSTGNTGNEATFQMNATGGPFNIYGFAILSQAAKSSTGGVGMAASRLDNPRLNIAVNDKLGTEYVVVAADSP